AYEVAVELVASLREPVAAIRTKDRSLADQLQRAATSVALNVAEGRRRVGRDGRHLYRIALGSAAEVGAALDVAVAWRHVDPASLAASIELADRERAILWRLLHA
ncbi:four helix bundle protein, partial [bacterium]|nr:four helix bundle protein [bacterium]